MTTTLDTLIDKQDNFEIVRDQIAQILADESANQQTLATNDGKDPNDFKFRVFTEVSNPWAQFQHPVSDTTPLVNVWFNDDNINESASNIGERQQHTATYNIDCYGYGVAAQNGSGHDRSDRVAAFEAQRACRLVRNTLMAGHNRYLQLQGTVSKRWPQARTAFQPQLDNNSAQMIVALRLALNVTLIETAPQLTLDTLDRINVDIERASDGQVIAEADFDYS